MFGFKPQTDVSIENRQLISQFSPHPITGFRETPLITEGLIAYWKPGTNVSGTDGSTISTWTDIVGRYVLYTPFVAGFSFIYNVTENISNPGASITGSSTTKYMLCDNFPDLGTNTGLTLIAINSTSGPQQIPGPSIGKIPFGLNSLNQAGDYGLHVNQGAGSSNKSASFRDSSTKTTAVIGAGGGQRVMQGLVIDRENGVLSNWVNRGRTTIAIDANTNNLVSTNPFRIGFWQSSTAGYALTVLDILVYNRSLTTLEMFTLYDHFRKLSGV